jgi:hypothetical protein
MWSGVCVVGAWTRGTGSGVWGVRVVGEWVWLRRRVGLGYVVGGVCCRRVGVGYVGGGGVVGEWVWGIGSGVRGVWVVGEWVWLRRRVDVGDVVGAWARRIARGDVVRVGAWSLLASGCGVVGEWVFGGVRCRRVGVRCLVGGMRLTA